MQFQFNSFNDFEAFKESVHDVDCSMMLQNPNKRIWSTYHIKFLDIHVQLGKLGSGNIVEGQSSSNGYIIYQPLTDTCEYSANGTVLGQHSFMILEPGCDFCISTKDEHDWCSIFIPSSKLIRGSDPVEPSSDSEKMICQVFHSNPQVTNQFFGFVRRLMTIGINYSQIESDLLSNLLAEEALEIVSLILGQRQGGETNLEGRPCIPRQEIIRRSQKLIEKRKGQPILVGELSAAAGVSQRTLRRAFNEYFGVSPVRYLQLRQLNQIHLALKSADPEELSVSSVMLKYGVCEFGRFASKYRELFGKLPSETLQTNKG